MSARGGGNEHEASRRLKRYKNIKIISKFLSKLYFKNSCHYKQFVSAFMREWFVCSELFSQLDGIRTFSPSAQVIFSFCFVSSRYCDRAKSL